jgi:glyoxylase-like metal-dependent hydrolase (beta-lactamase superfamily II)
MNIESFFDPATSTFTHVLWDGVMRRAAIVDSVLDYDPKSGRTRTTSADRVVARVRELELKVDWLLETHVHADHLSAAPYLKERVGGQIVIGSEVTQVQRTFGTLFNAGDEFARDGRQFDRLVAGGDHLDVGGLRISVLPTPGHTPACVSYVFEDGAADPPQRVAFIGDTLFMPDFGTARCDFPGGNARELYRSIRKLLSLPADTQLYLCHDYPPVDRAPQHVTTVAAQRSSNVHVHDGVDEEAFVKLRDARDATLAMPVLLLPAVQVNMRAGHLPPPEDNGIAYLKIPLNAV